MRLIWIFCVVAALGCGDKKAGEKSKSASQAAPAGAVYECPMHCKSEGSDEPYRQSEPGTCPVCGMDLKKTPAE